MFKTDVILPRQYLILIYWTASFLFLVLDLLWNMSTYFLFLISCGKPLTSLFARIVIKRIPLYSCETIGDNLLTNDILLKINLMSCYTDRKHKFCTLFRHVKCRNIYSSVPFSWISILKSRILLACFPSIYQYYFSPDFRCFLQSLDNGPCGPLTQLQVVILLPESYMKQKCQVQCLINLLLTIYLNYY